MSAHAVACEPSRRLTLDHEPTEEARCAAQHVMPGKADPRPLRGRESNCEDDRNEELDESPVPDPEATESSTEENDPGAD